MASGPGQVYAQSSNTSCPDPTLSELDCDAIQQDWPNWIPDLGDNSDFGCSATGSTSLVGGDNEEKVWNYLRGQGLTPVATAGIMGNFEQESSGFDPAAKESKYTMALPAIYPKSDPKRRVGYGIAQWTYDTRQDGLFAKMDEAGLQDYYGEGWGHPERDKTMSARDNDALLLLELNYAWEQDSTTIKGLKDKLNEITTEKGDKGTAVFFHNAYEGSGDNASQIQERVTSATKILGKYSDVTTTDSGGCSGTLGGVSTMEDALPWALKFVSDTDKEYHPGNRKLDQKFGGDLVNVYWTSDRVVGNGGGCWGAKYCGQCTALSGWFVTKMTDYTYNNGNGSEVVANLAAKGVKTGKEPQPFSVFSWGNISDAGHTGLVMGVLEGGMVITIENNWPDGNLVIRKYNIKEKYPDVRFAYVGDKLKTDIVN
ncbi:hypothetical protein KDA14_02405 [Candidatus Saccharibacteria bacterium]|nr:hypothetical protein [Candidatus Saccharibacteria bacterium]